jgi:hypothetical protein
MKFILIFITAAFRRRRVPMRVLMIAMLIAAWPGMAGATDEMRWLSETSCTQLIAGKAIPAGASEGFVARINEIYRPSCKGSYGKPNLKTNPCLIDFMGGNSPGRHRVALCRGGHIGEPGSDR